MKIVIFASQVIGEQALPPVLLWFLRHSWLSTFEKNCTELSLKILKISPREMLKKDSAHLMPVGLKLITNFSGLHQNGQSLGSAHIIYEAHLTHYISYRQFPHNRKWALEVITNYSIILLSTQLNSSSVLLSGHLGNLSWWVLQSDWLEECILSLFSL